ncbi:HlyD family type I secretion periplasmic adaptor subunit [Roseospirillum parvum]|uniref:Membrane fusion protein (MFP) family protein n=1 Tax=Roseospirillum parvum TaxID=83401 RepID=A0A1G7YEU4_9PROT|nr:HlyD family type I secretion periplasmic adaptor subunit [Roseospirillum parvum]SDG94846.1 membrane fusion protein, adhesin transport system [Roseospirillum parvum]
MSHPPPDSPLARVLARHRLPGWRPLGWLVMALLAGLVAWASVAELDEVAVATGEVVPQGRVKTIQHLEGGIIAELMVREGDRVSPGTPLVRLDLAVTAMNKEEMEVRLDGLLLTRARLAAEAEGRPPELPPEFPPGPAERRPALLASEQSTYRARQQELISTLGVLADQQRQRQADIAEITSRRASLARELDLAEERLAMSADLLAEGLTARMEHVRLEGEVESLRGELESQGEALARARAALSEISQRITETRQAFRREALENAGEVEADIARHREMLKLASDQARRTVIESPITGVVKNLRFFTIGGVVSPGAPIMDIVPSRDRLVVEARLSPVDRGYVREGQPATVKVSTYDFARYGGLEGEVIHVAPDSTTPEGQAPFFRVVVATDRTWLGDGPGDLPISPGMQATVDIHTGTRTVLDYLIRPVLKLRHEAFRER